MNFCFDRFEISLQNILKDDPLQPGMDDLPLLSENIYGEANQQTHTALSARVVAIHSALGLGERKY